MYLNRLFLLMTVLTIWGCATPLTEQGSRVRLVQSQSDFNCNFVGTVTGSNSMGNSTAHDAEGAMNQLRNKAANLGANAVRVINVSTTEAVTTTVGEALSCQF
ncbi:MAG: DUF4156 domain-containing protein [Gammaproteobacteria bacterium]|nr:DUF4156 domain-containing protein [Gammaproteobacteria bacterium]